MPKDLENDELFEEDIDDGDERTISEDESEQQLDLDLGQGEQERLAEDEDGDDSEDQGRDEAGSDQERPDSLTARSQDGPNSRQRRSNGHYQKLAEERNRLREENQRIAAEKAALEAERQREQALRAQVQQQTEQERLAQMLPEERNEYRLNQISAQITYQEQQRVFDKADAQDAANFNALAKTNKLYARHQAAVEKSLAQLRAQGQNMPREVLLRYHVGEEMLKNSEKNSKPLNPTKTRQVPRPNNSRADVSQRQGTRKPSSEKERILKQWGDTPL